MSNQYAEHQVSFAQLELLWNCPPSEEPQNESISVGTDPGYAPST